MSRQRLAKVRLGIVTVLVAATFAATGCSGAGAAHDVTAVTTAPPKTPKDGSALFGVHLDWTADSPAAYQARTGIAPAAYGDYISTKPTAAEREILSGHVAEAAAAHANISLTLEPTSGLASVTESVAQKLAKDLAAYNKTGVWFYVRFAHEMNGGWYPWGQQPIEYIKAFRLMADAIHSGAPGNLMVWAPSSGGGYPFTGGQYTAKPGTPDFDAMDTNRDHQLTMADDPYAPFYPGDAYVDWVGLTLYFFGSQYPYGANVLPDNRFDAQMDGTYNGSDGDQRALPSFYQEFAVGHRKPMLIAETAALYNPSDSTGASESSIKIAWINQVLDPANARRYPYLKMVNWFEIKKSEAVDHGVVDWRSSFDPSTLKDLQSHLKTKQYSSVARP
jgi:hypothetical protein